jgi:hypothetical protein
MVQLALMHLWGLHPWGLHVLLPCLLPGHWTLQCLRALLLLLLLPCLQLLLSTQVLIGQGDCDLQLGALTHLLLPPCLLRLRAVTASPGCTSGLPPEILLARAPATNTAAAAAAAQTARTSMTVPTWQWMRCVIM